MSDSNKSGSDCLRVDESHDCLTASALIVYWCLNAIHFCVKPWGAHKEPLASLHSVCMWSMPSGLELAHTSNTTSLQSSTVCGLTTKKTDPPAGIQKKLSEQTACKQRIRQADSLTGQMFKKSTFLDRCAVLSTYVWCTDKKWKQD